MSDTVTQQTESVQAERAKKRVGRGGIGSADRGVWEGRHTPWLQRGKWWSGSGGGEGEEVTGAAARSDALPRMRRRQMLPWLHWQTAEWEEKRGFRMLK